MKISESRQIRGLYCHNDAFILLLWNIIICTPQSDIHNVSSITLYPDYLKIGLSIEDFNRFSVIVSQLVHTNLAFLIYSASFN